MKKAIAIISALTLALTAFAGCSAKPGNEQTDDGRLSIVCTIYPLYDWVMNVLGDRAADADVTLLLDNGVDLHSFQATAEDLLTISHSDVFVYVGGESDNWVNGLAVDTSGVAMVNVMEDLDAYVVEEEKSLEENGEEASEETEYDEHVWMSLGNASFMCGRLAEVIGKADPENADAYAANADAYRAQIDALKAEYADMAASAANDTVLVPDRFPFTYLFNEIGIKHIAAFAGCSTEANASFDTVMKLADSLNELELKYVVVTETSDGKTAETVIETAHRDDVEILTLNAMQSVTADMLGSVTYLGVMRENLETLKKALS